MKKRAASICILSMTAVCPVITLSAPTAKAEECQYPAVGVVVNAVLGGGFFCNYPTEINGSHLQCEAGSSVGFGRGGFGGNNTLGGGGASCTWRCPDNTLAPAPNPPGAWTTYMTPQPNACADHMEPIGSFSEPVRPDEGVPPEGSPGLPRPTALPEPPPSAPGFPDSFDPEDPSP